MGCIIIGLVIKSHLINANSSLYCINQNKLVHLGFDLKVLITCNITSYYEYLKLENHSLLTVQFRPRYPQHRFTSFICV